MDSHAFLFSSQGHEHGTAIYSKDYAPGPWYYLDGNVIYIIYIERDDDDFAESDVTFCVFSGFLFKKNCWIRINNFSHCIMIKM